MWLVWSGSNDRFWTGMTESTYGALTRGRRNAGKRISVVRGMMLGCSWNWGKPDGVLLRRLGYSSQTTCVRFERR
jgi:hypothetical protein